MIFASEVPVIARLNRYRHVEDVFYSVWKRVDPAQVARMERQLTVLSPEEQMEHIIEEAGAKDIATEAIKQSSTLTHGAELNQVAESLAHEIRQLPGATVETKNQLVSHFTSELQKDYGARTEAKAIGHYESIQKESVRDNNKKFYKLFLGPVGNTDVFVGGRVDGLNSRGRVVEVKNRMKKFFDPLPKYDVAQLQTYLQILDCNEGELIEHLRRKNNLETHTTIIGRDDRYWETKLKPSMLQFACALDIFMYDEELQMQFLQEQDGHERLKIIQSIDIDS
ncbi:hypothetical protein THAOC_32082 [Thalassiosira oceanica]|uniref:YqaJ viral recombinase domain-containing protein n=1 Tax=Thalassiosira oceanica TaxID=159749 RepID=K0R7X8_THAOC|nr:hypothetical protein THAOC_32082 [Thalassiosira oceanica]|eukprot:EJK49075.1 hypothetical protein THAOC_32082 [Thalassiosira oceanica]